MSRLNEISNVKRCLVALIKFSSRFLSITASRATYWLIGIRLVWVWQSTRRNPSAVLCNKRWLQRRSFRKTCFSCSKSMWFLFSEKRAPYHYFLASRSITCKQICERIASVFGEINVIIGEQVSMRSHKNMNTHEPLWNRSRLSDCSLMF